ncbi:hypothetical protein RCO48_21920 [Peribacillus frigoritolerans]|nr:hypothetical protein [Peribacillus frigoritolerans]
MQKDKRYWIGVASRDHVMKGIDGGFAQLCHGKEAPLKKDEYWRLDHFITLQR